MNRKFLCGTVFFTLLSVMAEDKTIWSCSSVSEMAGKGIVPFASKGYRCSTSIPADVRTPDGEPVIAFKAGTPPGAANPYGKQINFLYRKPVANGQKYRLSFYYKGSCDGEVVYSPALQYAPYTGFAPKSTETLTVTTQWRKATMEFTVNKSVQPPLAMPRFRLGTFPDGETFYLGPVTLEKVK